MKRLLVLMSILGLLSACSESMTESSLVGVYQVKKNGTLKDFLKVEKKNGQYQVHEKSGTKWLVRGKLKTAKKARLEGMMGKKIKIDFVGLSNRDMSIYRMPKGWSMEGFKTPTGYWLGTMMGPITLYKK